MPLCIWACPPARSKSIAASGLARLTASLAYSVAAEDEELSLLWAAPFVRIFYAAFLDTARLLSALDEWRGTRMTWGKLDRLGRLR